MTRTRAFAIVAAVLGSSALSAAVTPVAYADPMLDQTVAAVVSARNRGGCPALTYSSQLEAAAQQLVRVGVLDPHGYPGSTVPILATPNPSASATFGITDPVAGATFELLSMANGRIQNCENTDFGVGLVRSAHSEGNVAGLVLGRPAAKPPVGVSG